MQLNTRNARPARKSLGDKYPATGRTVKPERSGKHTHTQGPITEQGQVGHHTELHTRSLTHIHTFQKDRDVLQLRDVVLSVTTVFDQQGEIFQILPAGVTGIQFAQFSEDYAPRAHFLCCVFNTWDGVSTGGTERNGTQALTDRKL